MVPFLFHNQHVVALAAGAGFDPLSPSPPTHHHFHFWMVPLPGAGLETLLPCISLPKLLLSSPVPPSIVVTRSARARKVESS